MPKCGSDLASLIWLSAGAEGGAARQRALESELEQLHRAKASALAKLETEQRAAAESMRSAVQALQAVIDRRVDTEVFEDADREMPA